MSANKKDVPLARIDVRHAGATGAWWGWIGFKKTPGEYDAAYMPGIRFRMKNIQIDGNDLIREVPTTNAGRSTFGRWSNWYVGEIHIDPDAVIPNARRDGFEEDDQWLAIRKEITEICETLTKDARTVSDEHQFSFAKVEAKVKKLRNAHLKTVNAKTFNIVSVYKLVDDAEKVQEDIEKAGVGSTNEEQVRLRSFAKEVASMKLQLLERPKTGGYEKYRDAIRREFLEKTLAVLNNYLNLRDFDEVKAALQKALK